MSENGQVTTMAGNLNIVVPHVSEVAGAKYLAWKMEEKVVTCEEEENEEEDEAPAPPAPGAAQRPEHAKRMATRTRMAKNVFMYTALFFPLK